MQRLFARTDLGEYDPEYFGERILEELRTVAVHTATRRIVSLGDDVRPETFAKLNKRIQAVTTARPSGEVWPTLANLAEREELLAVPEPLIPRLAWRGRHTLLAALAKLGKSTFVAQAVAASTRRGDFLDYRARGSRVVWIGIDEYLGDTVRRLQAHRTASDQIRILSEVPPDLPGALDRVLDDFRPDVVVLDSLIEWARRTAREVPGDGDAAGWAAIVRPLTALAHERDLALVTLHHARRSDGRYRSSGEIVAAVDYLIEMTGPRKREPPTVRHFEGRGRLPAERFTTRFEDGRYVLGRAEEAETPEETSDALETAILSYVAAEPGSSRRGVAGAVEGRTQDILDALVAMEARGTLRIERGGPGRAHQIYLDREDDGDGVAGGEEDGDV